MRGEAEFCSENKNRFLLKREWSKSKKKVLYIMFNPSNAKNIDQSQNISKKNLKILVKLINTVSDVVYAWGNSTDEPNFLKKLVDSPMCLGKNKDGSPKHPLYIPSNSKLLKFR